MKRYGATVFVAAMIALAILYAWLRLDAEIASPDQSTAAVPEETPRHLVTSKMAEASRGMVLRQAPDFRAHGNDGTEYSLVELTRKGPVLLTFTKIGCPCSEAAQPFFNRLAATYPRVRMLSVIDGELGPANLWARKLHVSYPAVLDPDLRLVRDYEVKNSAYVVLIDAEGRIVEHWPGYSASMLQELGATLARLTRSAIRPIDTLDAPIEFYSGCPYDL